MPKITWEQISEIEHDMKRNNGYLMDVICRVRILMDSMKETHMKLLKIIEEAEDGEVN